MITIDTLRADHVTAEIAPTLSRLAREAIVFDQAITVTPLTLPSHASLLTARVPPAHGVRDNSIYSLAAGTPTYTSLLRDRGYATAAFVSAVVLDSRYGLDAGFDTYDDELGGAPERRAQETIGRAREWLAANSGPRPFFVWIHLFEPHAPYLSGSYASEVTAVDRELDHLFSTLREQKIWDDLVLGVTSDHGESLGEHGEKTHGFFVYDSTLRIPWMVKAPGRTALRFPHQVRIVDVMPTMTALASSAVIAPVDIEGVDLDPWLQRDGSPALEAYADTLLPRDQFQWSELRGLRTERLKYIAAPRPELFDLVADPGERRNVISERPADARRMRTILEALERRRTVSPSHVASDPAIEERFMALGYIGYSPAAAAGAHTLPDPKDKLDVYNLTMSALELSEAGKPAEALAALARAERLDSGVTQIHYLKGSILGTQDRYAEAAAALERAVALNPRYVTARFKLALAYVRLKRNDRAEAMLRSVLSDEPRNVRAHHNLAAIAYSHGNLVEAERLERQAIAIDPNYVEAWNTLGAIHLVAKRPGQALDALNTAVRLDPSNGQAHYNLALALRAAGQAAAAESTAARACALDKRFCR
jgi:arylsulfatase A-like enzyme/Tfp pilus assembly protein PilF